MIPRIVASCGRLAPISSRTSRTILKPTCNSSLPFATTSWRSVSKISSSKGEGLASRSCGDKRRVSANKSHASSFKVSDSIDSAKIKVENMSSEFLNPSSVRHEKTNKRFVLDLGHGREARIDYKSVGRNKIDMYHTEVPVEMRGRGIGRVLAKGALDQAATNNTKVKLTCSYLVNYVEKFADDNTKKRVEK